MDGRINGYMNDYMLHIILYKLNLYVHANIHSFLCIFLCNISLFLLCRCKGILKGLFTFYSGRIAEL